MKRAFFKPSPFRLQVAGLTAAAGGIVSLAMVVFGGSMAMFLPVGEGFHLGAAMGAGLAGLTLASCFGRPGRRGWAIAALGAVAATLLGAVVGAGLLGLIYFAPVKTGALGLIAILGAVENPIAVLIWAVCMAALHQAARRLRHNRAFTP